MSEVEKALTDAYYWLSMYKSGAVPEGLAMEKVKEAIFDQPTLNENQQIVLEWLKADYIDDDESNPINSIWLLHDECAMGERSVAITAYTKLTNKQEAKVLQEFASWVEQEEE